MASRRASVVLLRRPIPRHHTESVTVAHARRDDGTLRSEATSNASERLKREPIYGIIR
jgi:hypothetical protein